MMTMTRVPSLSLQPLARPGQKILQMEQVGEGYLLP